MERHAKLQDCGVFLKGKEYENLFTIDFICHGVPSPGVFRWYLSEEIKMIAHKGNQKNSVLLSSIPSISERDSLFKKSEWKIKAISFRDKKKGWKKYSFALDLSKVTTAGEKNTVSLSYTLNKSAYLRGFLSNSFLRPSCYFCAFRQLKSGSDITLGDYWNIDTLMPNYDDDKGVSAVVVNTEKGVSVFNIIEVEKHIVPYEDLCKKILHCYVLLRCLQTVPLFLQIVEYLIMAE